jgi:hypothetical protein
MTGIARPADRIVWELRGAWARARVVRLTLAERCMVERVIGRVERIAVTGAFVVVDGWHIPADDILAVGFPPLCGGRGVPCRA